MSTVRRIGRDLLVYGAGDVLVRLTGILTLPVMSRVFTPADYGVMTYVNTAVGMLGGVLALGGDSAYARFYFAERDDEGRRRVTTTWFGFLAAWSVAVMLLLLPWSGRFSAWSFGDARHAWVYAFALLAAPLTLLNGLAAQTLRNEFRAPLFTGLSVASSLAVIAGSLLGVLVFHAGLAGVFAGTLAGTALLLPVRLWVIRHRLGGSWSWPLLRDLLRFGVPLVPVTFAYWVFGMADRLMLGELSTLDETGLYGLAASLTMALAFVNAALGQAWSPHAVQAYETDPAGAPALFGRVLILIVAGFGTLAVATTALAPEALRILATPAYARAADAVGPLALGYVAFASTQVTAAGISLTRRTWYFMFYTWIAALVNVVLNWFTLRQYGMVAAAWNTAIAYGVLTLLYYATTQRLWPIAVPGRRLLVLSTVTVTGVLGTGWLPVLPLPAAIALKAAWILGYLAVLLLLDAESREAVRGLMRRVRSGDVPSSASA